MTIEILYSSAENSTKKIHGIRKRCKCCIAIWSINTCPVTQKPCAQQDATNATGTAAFFSYSIELVSFSMPPLVDTQATHWRRQPDVRRQPNMPATTTMA